MESDGKAPASSPREEESLTQRLLIVETELRALKGTITQIFSFAGIIFGMFAIALAWNVSSERSELRESRREIKDEVRAALGQVIDEPEISLYSEDNRPLDGATVRVDVGHDSTRIWISIPMIIRNDGKGWTGDVALKTYTTEVLPQIDRSTDEPAFSYEERWVGAQTNIPSLPGKYSERFNIGIWPRCNTVQSGRYPCLVKVYYGRGKVARANFTIWVASTNSSAPPN